MEDKLLDYFSENKFDFQEPHSGHLDRFENKLNSTTSKQQFSLKWMSAAASVILVLGFWLGGKHQQKQFELADVSPEMEEVQSYFVNTIHQEIKTIESYRSLDTEFIIEEALNQIEELEEDYTVFLSDLKTNKNQTEIINAMIKNYQQRLEVLENLLKQIEQIKNPKIINNELFL